MSLLGDKLKDLRGKQSLYEAANKLGIPRGQLLRYENGQVPQIQTLKKLAAFYSVSYKELRWLNLEDIYAEPEEREIVQSWVLEGLKKV